MTSPPDIVPDVDDAELREIYGRDAEEIIAFKRFLRLAGPVRPITIDQPWYDYATGKLTGAQAVLIEDHPPQP